MLRQCIIEPKDSAKIAPIVLVDKELEREESSCLDHRRLNCITQLCIKILPDFYKHQKCQIFSKGDLANGYWQVNVIQRDKHKLYFSTPQSFNNLMRPKDRRFWIGKLWLFSF